MLRATARYTDLERGGGLSYVLIFTLVSVGFHVAHISPDIYSMSSSCLVTFLDVVFVIYVL